LSLGGEEAEALEVGELVEDLVELAWLVGGAQGEAEAGGSTWNGRGSDGLGVDAGGLEVGGGLEAGGLGAQVDGEDWCGAGLGGEEVAVGEAAAEVVDAGLELGTQVGPLFSLDEG
jgi:hypothetical protein